MKNAKIEYLNESFDPAKASKAKAEKKEEVKKEK
jgi:hypothetical protein